MPSKKSHYFNLSNWGAINVFGPDSDIFLQNLLTVSVDDIKQNSQINLLTLGGLCNSKGRLLSTFQIIKDLKRSENSYLLYLSKDLVSEVIDELKKYKFRSKVSIENLIDTYQVVGVISALEFNHLEKICSKPIHLMPDNFRLSTQKMELHTAKFYLTLAATNIDVIDYEKSQTEFDLNEVLSGIPRLTKATSLKFVPQMINLDLLEGVNFKKGCYPGQEIVARTQYLGSIKRRLFLIESYDSSKLAIGEDLSDAEGNVVGNVVLSAFDEISGKQYSQVELALSSIHEKIYIKDSLNNLRNLAIRFLSQPPVVKD